MSDTVGEVEGEEEGEVRGKIGNENDKCLHT